MLLTTVKGRLREVPVPSIVYVQPRTGTGLLVLIASTAAILKFTMTRGL